MTDCSVGRQETKEARKPDGAISVVQVRDDVGIKLSD